MQAMFLSQLLKAISSIFQSATAACRDFSRDPLSHPVLDGMSLTELADIPAGELRAQGRV